MFEWLSSYQKLEQEIYYLDWELEVDKRELERWCDPDDLGRYSLTKESKASKLEEIIAEKEYRLANKMNDILDLRTIVYGFKGIDQHIMRMKYIDGLSLKEIAGELDHGYTYIRKRHANLLNKLTGYNKGTNPIDKS